MINKPKMAYSRDLAVMDYLGLSWMTFMDDWTLLFISYFYILLTDRLTDGWTDRWTLVPLKPLSQLKIS